MSPALGLAVPMIFGLGFVLATFLVIGVGGALLLYLLVRAEHDTRQTMDRESAERAARKDSREGDGER